MTAIAPMAAKIACLAFVAWLLVGPGALGAALVAAVLFAPLMLVPLRTRAMTRALVAGTVYLWLAAYEIGSGATILFGPETEAPAGWEQSVTSAVSDVLIPLLQPAVLAGAGLWAAAAATLPLLVRGRVPVLDAVGALIWAAALITALRLLGGPQGEPNGLMVAALLVAAGSVLLLRRVRGAPAVHTGTVEDASHTVIRRAL